MKKINRKIEKKIETEKEIKKVSHLFRGRVISVKNAKTATVLIEGRKMHHLYKKSFARSKKYLVHDDLGVKMGDVVDIAGCKPMSKNKHFKIVKVVGRDIEAIVTEQINEEAQSAIEEILPVEIEEELNEKEKEEGVEIKARTGQSVKKPKLKK